MDLSNYESANPAHGCDGHRPRGAHYIAGAPSFEELRALSHIRIRRLPSAIVMPLSQVTPTQVRAPWQLHNEAEQLSEETRRSSAPNLSSCGVPQSIHLSRSQTVGGAATSQTLASDEGPEGVYPKRLVEPPPAHKDDGLGSPTGGTTAQDTAPVTPTSKKRKSIASILQSPAQTTRGSLRSAGTQHRPETAAPMPEYGRPQPHDGMYGSQVIDLLDLVDPEVQTLGILTHLQNSLFVPDLGFLLNRRGTYDLLRRPTTFQKYIPEGRCAEHPEPDASPSGRPLSLSSHLSDAHYAVLPHGTDIGSWSDKDMAELNDHVQYLMHSKRESFKRHMRGFKQYISHPLGLFIVVYATLVTLFGLAWVLALIGWIYVGKHQQKYFVNVIDLTLVALFALMGDGLAPFRAVDTYHMCFIAHYHHLTWRLRQEHHLPSLVDENDLPRQRMDVDGAVTEDTAEFSVLTVRQQKRLRYHEAKFSKSHTFYKPHETTTHHAFPIKLMIAAVVLLDCHSILQVALGTCTWSINYRVRPRALTAVILSFSLACNIAAGIIITVGDHQTRKKDVFERVFRQGLTEQALVTLGTRHCQDGAAIVVDP